MNFEPCDRTLNWEFAYWVSAIRQWYNDGLPRKEGISEEFLEAMLHTAPRYSGRMGQIWEAWTPTRLRMT
jgi:hypothetical protein